MPRRRPPGAGPGILFTILFVLPLITAAAQQQQSPDNAKPPRRAPPEDAFANSASEKAQKPPSGHLRHASKHNDYTPLNFQNERAVATEVSSAPALPAVRAPVSRNAAPSGGLTSDSARSLQDWEIEDFVLLATVDGQLHARDRYNGNEIWKMDIERPMLDTTYNVNKSQGESSLDDQSFIWIVEPKEDGALYILTPGPRPVLKSLKMTVKQLAEELSPFSSDDPPVVYTAEKKNMMLVVDARTGNVTKSFSPGGSMILDSAKCESPKAMEYFGSRERECSGVLNIGRTEYLISIANAITLEHICTIKYSEWIPNIRDRDLQSQYREPMDKHYIYSRYDGNAISLDHKRSRPRQRPLFQEKFASPVARVFDVARPNDNDDPEAALVLLSQPPGPQFVAEKSRQVWLNTTESGSWYALSEINYPAVTDAAPPALCYSPEWDNNDLLNFDGLHYLPDRTGLVGVHILDQVVEARTRVPQLDAPSPSEDTNMTPSNGHDHRVQEPNEDIRPVIDASPSAFWVPCLVLLVILCTSLGYLYRYDQTKLQSLLSRILKSQQSEPTKVAISATPQAEAQEAEQLTSTQAVTESVPVEQPVHNDVHKDLTEKIDDIPVETEQEKKVRFDVPGEEEEFLEPLSRSTTAEQPSPTFEDGDANGTPKSSADSGEPNADGTLSQAATPTKKKKTHRGKRGGVKKSLKKPKDEDEVDQIVKAAKELENTPTLHPDEVTVNGDDVQDVSNKKKIGKLTIDFDLLLGNGSGGTFVFEGEWNKQRVAVKRMLPHYFGLAEQEVKLLQESDLHPNVIRYFDDEKDENFLYIAVELCQASLFDLFRDGRPGEELTETQKRLATDINMDVPRALYQLAQGVNHLHSLRIIHRDIKPQNILIAYPPRNQKNGFRLVISDFGLCKTLPDNISTLIGTTGNAGTVGWKAPELILQPQDLNRGSSTGHSRESSSSSDPVAQGVKRAVDIFSLGCVFFYVLTNGSHPYDDEEGWMQMRELNIKKDKANFDQLSLGDESQEPRHLIEWMLKNKPEDRPTATQVMSHPFFWSAEKRLNFLCDCSDHWERECRDPPSFDLSTLESFSPVVIGEKKPDFLAKLQRSFVNSLGKQRKYTGDRMLDLLRALRNKKNHYEDMDESVKAMVGPLPHGYLQYWTLKFPNLLISCYNCVVECGLQDEPRFRPYFEAQAAI